MRGCCCWSSKKHPLSEEVEPLSLHPGTVSDFSNGLLVDTNLNNSVPDTLHAPLASGTCEIRIGHPHLPSSCEENTGNKSKVASRTLGELLEDVIKDESLGNFKKSNEPLDPLQQEEECPTCLEEYDFDNPKIVTKCNHIFHLACILEWIERSNTCPVCDKEMIFSALNGG